GSWCAPLGADRSPARRCDTSGAARGAGAAEGAEAATRAALQPRIQPRTRASWICRTVRSVGSASSRTGAAASRALAAVVGHDRGDAHGVPRVAAAERIGRADAALDRVDLAAAGAVGLAAGAVGVVGLAGGGAQVVAHPAHAHAVPLGVAAV